MLSGTSIRLAAVLPALAAGALLALSSPALDARVLNIHNGGDASSLDPHKLSGDWENRIAGDIFEGLVTEDAAPGHFERLVEVTRTITASELRRLARTYLSADGWVEVVVGPTAPPPPPPLPPGSPSAR